MRSISMIAFTSIFIAAMSSALAADADHDGTWWREQSPAEKTRYAARLFDGLAMGSNLLEYGMSVQVPVTLIGSGTQGPAAQRYVRFDGGDVSRYIDRFYTDPRNSTISVARAGQIFLQSVAGTRRADLQGMIEEYRKPGC